MSVRLILIHSPRTGPSFWSGVRDALWASQHRAYLARLPDARWLHPPYWLTHAAGVAAGLPDEDRMVLVAHSGAGPLLPAIGRLARNRDRSASLAGYLFVDSDLPRDGCSRFDLFEDADAARMLRQRSTRGWLPRWRDGDLEAFIPDRRRRAALVAELPETPLALYEEPITVPDDWPEAPCGYLRLSRHYEAAAREASRLGWACREIGSHHFLPWTEPQTVADALLELVHELVAPVR